MKYLISGIGVQKRHLKSGGRAGKLRGISGVKRKSCQAHLIVAMPALIILEGPRKLSCDLVTSIRRGGPDGRCGESWRSLPTLPCPAASGRRVSIRATLTKAHGASNGGQGAAQQRHDNGTWMNSGMQGQWNSLNFRLNSFNCVRYLVLGYLLGYQALNVGCSVSPHIRSQPSIGVIFPKIPRRASQDSNILQNLTLFLS